MRHPLDLYDEFPSDMRKYLSNNGWHFSKKAVEYAGKFLSQLNPATNKMERVDTWKKEEVDELLKKNNITLENNAGYDYVYVANLCKAKHFKSSVKDEESLAKYVKEEIDDCDAGDGNILRCWYARMVSLGIPVDWEEML